MFALGPIAQAEQQANTTAIKRHQQASHPSDVASRLLDGKNSSTSGQKVRPCSASSRPTSAMGASRQRPASAAPQATRPLSPWTADTSSLVEHECTAEGGPDQPEDISTQSGPRLSTANRSRRRSALSSRQQHDKQQHQQQHHVSQQQQQQHITSQQLQRPRSPSILRALRPSQPTTERSNYKVKAASFPQQQLLQHPAPRVPDVITTLLTSADWKHSAAAAAAVSAATPDTDPMASAAVANNVAADDDDDITPSASPEAAVFIAAGVAAAAAAAVSAAAAPLVDVHNPKRHASIINIGCTDLDCTTSSNCYNRYSCDKLSCESNRDVIVTNNSDDVIMSDTTRPGLLTVLGTIQEEDSVMYQQQQQQHQEDSPIAEQQYRRCSSPVNLPDDISLDSSSFTNSGRTSPVAAAAMHRCQQQQQQRRSRSACSSRDQHCRQQQQQQQHQDGVTAVDTDNPSTALSSRGYNPLVRPLSAAAMQAAKRLYGGRAHCTAMQQLDRQQQQQQQQRRCESAQARYSIDTRLISRSGGRFSPSVSVQASRGGGFCIRQQQQQSRPSSSSRLYSGARSATPAAAAAAEVISLTSLLSASRCGSRQQQRHRQQQQILKADVPVYTAATCNRAAVADAQEVQQEVQSAQCAAVNAVKEVSSCIQSAALQPTDSDSTNAGHSAGPAADPASADDDDDHPAEYSQPPSSSRSSSREGSSTELPPYAAGTAPSAAAAAAAATSVQVPAAGGQVLYRLENSVPLTASAVAAAHLRERQQQCLSAKKAVARMNAAHMCHQHNRSVVSRSKSTSAAAAGVGRKQQTPSSLLSRAKHVYTSSSRI